MAVKDVQAIVQQLVAAYPNAKVSEQTVVVYLRMLQDIPADELQTVVDQCIAQQKFIPTVAEIRDMHRTLTVSLNRPTAAEAWGEVRRAIMRVGHIRVPEFDDPLVAEAVKHMGWRELCVSENQVADRARFLQTYEQLSDRREQGDKLLPPARQLAERNGMKRLTAVGELLPELQPINGGEQ
jgi:hypothetical protein